MKRSYVCARCGIEFRPARSLRAQAFCRAGCRDSWRQDHPGEKFPRPVFVMPPKRTFLRPDPPLSREEQERSDVFKMTGEVDTLQRLQDYQPDPAESQALDTAFAELMAYKDPDEDPDDPEAA